MKGMVLEPEPSNIGYLDPLGNISGDCGKVGEGRRVEVGELGYKSTKQVRGRAGVEGGEVDGGRRKS